MVLDESNQVSNAFHRYAETGDQDLISSFSRKQIELAIIQFTNNVDRNAPFYHAMEKRVAELKEQEERKRKRVDVWKDRAIGIVIGIIIVLLGNALWKLFVK